MSLNTANYIAVQRGITARFDEGARRAQPYFPRLCTVVPSSSRDEAYAMLGRMPGMRKWVGERVFHELAAADLKLVNEDWESSVEVPRFDIDDDRLNMYGTAMSSLGREAAEHPDQELFKRIRSAGTSECWDGQNFFDTDHLWRKSGTQSNSITYTVANTSDIQPHEIKGAFNKALIQMMSLKRDNGGFWIRPTVQQIGNLEIVCPLQMYVNAFEAFGNDLSIQLRGSSAAAVRNVHIEKPTVTGTPYYGAESGGSNVTMDLYYHGGELKPYLFQLRQRLRRQTKGIRDIEDKAVKFMTEARYTVGYLAWFYAIRVTFST